MKAILSSPQTYSFACVLAWLVLTLPAAAQDTPPNNVDIKERQEAEKAQTILQKKWVDYFKTNKARILNAEAPPKVAPQALLSLAAEKLLPAPQRQSLARETTAEFVEPDVVRSEHGELHLTLEGNYAHNHIGADPVHLRAFNGKLVGPTLRVKPGDKLHIIVKNLLPGERWLPNMMNTLNSFNTFNMHYHGLHVSPNGISDNVLIQIGPHETQNYELDIPKDHTTGTYWYHPHRHGSTAGTVASGMSGALIIEGGLDDIPEIKAAKDRVFVLNQIPYIYKNDLPDPNSNQNPPPIIHFDLKEGEVEAKYADYIFGPGDWVTLGRYTTVNGVQLPVIRMHPGEVERWRLVDSGQREMIMLKIVPAPSASTVVLPPITFHEIAVDGLALGKMVDTTSIELWPGYRSDVLVQAPPIPGEYLLIDDAVPASNTINGQNKPLNYVGRIIVEGKPETMKLPTNAQMAGLRLPSIKDSEITGHQEAKYGILLVGNNVVFTIDRKPFTMETARELKLNDVDEWTLSSVNDVGPVTHPFHIHVNPFEVTSIMAPDANGKLVEQLTDGPTWRDTVKIPGGGYVKMRTKYTDFIGTFVQHCHILDHEDQGMMELIDIVDKKANGVAAAAPAAQATPTAPAAPGLGAVVPDVVLPDAEGKAHSLAEIEGKPAVVFFFEGHSCLHCVQQVTAFTEHYQSFLERGIQVIGITSDDRSTLKTALKEYPCPFTLLADPKGVAFAKFGCVKPNGLLHGTFVLNAESAVQWRTIGPVPYLGVEDLLENFAPRTSAKVEAPAAATRVQ